MSKIMEANYKNGVQEHPHLLRESVDALRKCVKDLYDLDEDNYQLIKDLRKIVTENTKQIKNVRTSVVSMHAKHISGALMLGGLIWLARKVFKEQAKEINELNERVNKLEGNDTSEESDG